MNIIYKKHFVFERRLKVAGENAELFAGVTVYPNGPESKPETEYMSRPTVLGLVRSLQSEIESRSEAPGESLETVQLSHAEMSLALSAFDQPAAYLTDQRPVRSVGSEPDEVGRFTELTVSVTAQGVAMGIRPQLVL